MTIAQSNLPRMPVVSTLVTILHNIITATTVNLRIAVRNPAQVGGWTTLRQYELDEAAHTCDELRTVMRTGGLMAARLMKPGKYSAFRVMGRHIDTGLLIAMTEWRPVPYALGRWDVASRWTACENGACVHLPARV